jgi:hypothetical protein
MREYPALRSTVYAATVVLVCLAAPAAWGQPREKDEEPFEVADLLFELNHTDGDLGLHAMIDGDEWRRLELEDPRERLMLDLRVSGRLRKQGLTEIFFESAEPSFDELSPEAFFERFPEGEYEVSGTTLDGTELESTDMLSHVMPAPPGNITISGATAAENCDAEPLPAVDGNEPVLISWAPVTQSHPEIGESGPIEVVKYQLVVEREEPTLLIFSADLPPDVTQLEIPAGFIDLAEEFKFEIVVREATGNQTVVESCFEVEQ